jgi:hypothetical protein
MPAGDRCALVVALVISFAAPAAASPPIDAQAALARGHVAYERGNYGDAVTTIQPLLYPTIELATEEQVVEAHRLLALSYFFMAKQKDAEQEAASLLALRPTYELDPVVDPPEAVRFFRSVRERQEERLRAIRERQREEEQRARRDEERRRLDAHAKAERVYVERTVEHHSRIIASLPFGAGQFQNHQVGYGIAFAVSEVLLGGWWIGMSVAIEERYKSGLVPHSDKDTANTLLAVQVASAAAFWAVVGWGVVDAHVKFKPDLIVNTRELLAPPRGHEPKKKLQSVLFTPIISPSLYGLGVQGAF